MHSNNLKILYINASDENGGPPRIVNDLMSSMEKNGNSSVLFSGSKFSNRKNIVKIKKSAFRNLVSRLMSNDIDFFKTDYLIKTKEFNNADVVHAHNINGWYFNLDTLRKMAEKKNVIWTLHDMWAVTPYCAHDFGCGENNGFYGCPSLGTYPSILWHNEAYLVKRKREIYKNLDINIVVPSNWLREKILNSVLKTKRIYLIPNGVDTLAFTPQNKENSRESLNLPKGKKIIFFSVNGGIGNKNKGGNFFIEIADKYKNNSKIIFLCVGGEQEGIDGNIIYRRGIENKNILASYYSASDVFLFPSLAENFPLVVLESMSCGLPVVSFDVGGVKEQVVHKEHGYISKYKDINDIICGIDYILNKNDNEIAEISSKCRERIIKNFSIEKMVESYTNLYRKVRFNEENI